MDETLTLKPSGGSDGKKSFKNMICLWNVEIKNWEGHSKLEMHYDLLEKVRHPYVLYSINNGYFYDV